MGWPIDRQTDISIYTVKIILVDYWVVGYTELLSASPNGNKSANEITFRVISAPLMSCITPYSDDKLLNIEHT